MYRVWVRGVDRNVLFFACQFDFEAGGRGWAGAWAGAGWAGLECGLAQFNENSKAKSAQVLFILFLRVSSIACMMTGTVVAASVWCCCACVSRDHASKQETRGFLRKPDQTPWTVNLNA